MDGPRDCPTEWSQRKTNLSYHWYVQSEEKGKWYKLIYLQERSRVTYTENLWGKEGGTNWEVGIDIHSDIYIK